MKNLLKIARAALPAKSKAEVAKVAKRLRYVTKAARP